MAGKSTTETFNAALRVELEEAVNHRENPRIISLMRHLIRLSNSPDDNAKLDAAEKAAAPVCEHETVNRRTGKCLTCGEDVSE